MTNSIFSDWQDTKNTNSQGTHSLGRGNGLPVGWKVPKGYVTNEQFASQNNEFRVACENANIQPTKRQASKWRRKMGKAYRNFKML